MKLRLTCSAFILIIFSFSVLGESDFSEEELKEDAVNRLVTQLDTKLPLYIARIYVKQVALRYSRDVLKQFGESNQLNNQIWDPEGELWKSSENYLLEGVDDVISEKIMSDKWLLNGWSKNTSILLNAEEADEIAVHFKTEGGALQRRIIEWYVGELALTYYTLGIESLVRWGLRGSEKEMQDLQKKTYELKSYIGCGKYAHVNSPCHTTFAQDYDLTEYDNAMRFASRGPGVEFMKMMMLQGVHVIHVHAERVANIIRNNIKSRSHNLSNFIDSIREN